MAIDEVARRIDTELNRSGLVFYHRDLDRQTASSTVDAPCVIAARSICCAVAGDAVSIIATMPATSASVRGEP